MTRRGITLLELLVALVMSVFVVMSAASAFTTAVAYDKQTTELQDKSETRVRLEDRIRQLLVGAYVSGNQNDPSTYFLGDVTGQSESATAADSLTLTTMSAGFNGAVLTSEDDFETLNQNFGPQGGITEVHLGTTPVAETGQNSQGLFLRQQRPADGDPTQGGMESVLDADVQMIQFEFFDGTDWVTSWSTSGVNVANANQGQTETGEDGRRIPAAVRVTYTLTGEADDAKHTFIVRLPHSDVTTENPIVIAGGATGP